MEIQLDRQAVQETVQMRELADAVLHRLIEDRQASEQRLAEIGQPDQLKALTGQSAMDRAIALTGEIIRQTDALLAGEAAAMPARNGRSHRSRHVELVGLHHG